jgi:SAM-dependent methyltransferase
VLDIFDADAMTEPAIARARRMTGGVPAERARVDALPVEDGWADAIFLLLTAHEIRKIEGRDAFFAEIARILSPSGRVVLVEHLRDAWNAVAFGPGFFHFFPRREWLRTAAQARLRVETEYRITPFVRVFVLER